MNHRLLPALLWTDDLPGPASPGTAYASQIGEVWSAGCLLGAARMAGAARGQTYVSGTVQGKASGTCP